MNYTSYNVKKGSFNELGGYVLYINSSNNKDLID